MKLKIILLLAIFISFHSISRANDISEFEVEGISVGNSLLDFLSKDEIQNNTLPYFENKRKYFIVGYFNNLNKYDQIELYLKSGDKKYIIRSIIGGVFTVFGIVDGSVHSITKRLCKKKKARSDNGDHVEGNGTSKMYPPSVTGGLVY